MYGFPLSESQNLPLFRNSATFNLEVAFATPGLLYYPVVDVAGSLGEGDADPEELAAVGAEGEFFDSS